MKFIEFIKTHTTDKNNLSYSLLFLDILDISSFENYNDIFCKLITKNNNCYYIYGKYSNIVNRFTYTHDKKINIFNDINIKISNNFYYGNHKNIIIDRVLLDEIQIASLSLALNTKHLLSDIYDEESKNLILQTVNILDKKQQ